LAGALPSPQRPGLTLRDIDPAPKPTQRVAHDAPAGRARHPKQAMHHRQTGKTPPDRCRLQLPSLTVFKVANDARFIRRQAEPARARAKVCIAGNVIGERLDAHRRTRLEALAEG
jgi:hypothetical protein